MRSTRLLTALVLGLGLALILLSLPRLLFPPAIQAAPPVHSVIIDANRTDWPLTPTTQVNLGHIVRDSQGRGEYIWRDNPNDERTDFANPDPGVDLLEFRVTADAANLYFSALMSDITIISGDGAPQIQVAIDADLVSGSGQLDLGGNSETQVNSAAEWEYLLITRFGSGNGLNVWRTGYTTSIQTGEVGVNASNNVIEFSVPWTALQMSGPPTSPLRFTIATFRADTNDDTWDIASSSDALDAVTNYGTPGSTSNTSTEVSDGRIDYYFDLFFEPDGDIYSPLLISEALYDPTGTEPDAEFIELYNASPSTISLINHKLGDEETISGGDDGMGQFPGGSLAPGQVTVIANNAAVFTNTYHFLPTYAWTAGGQPVSVMTNYAAWASGTVDLNNAGDQVLLLDGSNTVLDVVAYGNASWPGVINNFTVSQGQSLERAPATQDTNDMSIDFRPRSGEGQPGRVTIGADLAITKTIAANPEVAGTGAVYTITIINQGVLTAENVTLSDILPLSTTLVAVDQIDNDNDALGFGGGAHNNTRWNDYRPGVDDNDAWLELNNSAPGSGQFTSRVMDAGYVGPWTNLTWLPRRPYSKPLPNNRQAETAYELGNVDMVGNRFLLHLNETGEPFADSSGQGHTGQCAGDCPTTDASGRFANALNFDGVNDQVVISDPIDPIRYAVELWVYPAATDDTSFILRTDSLSGTTYNYSHLLGIADGKFVHRLNDGSLRSVVGTSNVTPNTWYHLVGTAESNGDMKLYVNGREEGRLGNLGPVWTGGDEYRLGAAYGFTGTAAFSGRLDEVAVYSRTLSSGEVLDHYLRGALRLDFQARSCSNPDCSDGTWSGPYNDQSGVSSDPPAAALSLPNNRYFQYQATLETDQVNYSPQFRWVQAQPDHWLVQTTLGSCAPNSDDFTCALGSLNPGQTVTVTFPANLHPSLLGLITNTASVTTTTPEDDLINNTATAATVVTSAVRLEVVKYDDERDLPEDAPVDPNSADPVNPNSPLTYTLALYNHGPSTAWAVTLTDTMPINVGSLTAPSGWSCSNTGQSLTCTATNLLPWGWQYFTATGTAPATEGSITNRVAVTSAGSTVYTTSQLNDVETTTIRYLADLSIDKGTNQDPVDPNTSFTYVLTVTNNGPWTASNVTVVDTLPAGMTGSGSGCTGSNPVTCTTPNLAANSSIVFNISVTAPASGVIVNRAIVSSTTYDPDEDNNEVTLYTNIRRVADLSIAKTDSPDPVYTGQPLTYTITITNTGPVAAGVMTTQAMLDNDQYFVIPIGGRARPYRSTMGLFGLEGQIRNITVTLRDLSHTYPGDLVVLLTGPGGRSAVLMANAGGGVDASNVTLTFNDTGVSLPISNTLNTGTAYRPTNYGLGEDLPAPAPSGPYGGSLSDFYGLSPNGIWRLYVYDTFDSDGGEIANGWQLQITTVTTDTVMLTDTLPISLSNVNLSAAPGWQCGLSSQLMTCEADYLAVNDPEVFILTATAPLTAGVITNTAAVTSTVADLNPISNTAAITTLVLYGDADLGVSKTVIPTDPTPGSILTYTVVVTNSGPLAALNLVISDTLPVSVTFVASTTTRGAYTPAMSLWTVGSLAASERATLTLIATVNSGVVGNIVNTAALSQTGVIDIMPDNNTASATVNVGGPGRIYLPIICANCVPAPDLIVDRLVVAGNQVTVAVKNVGDLPVVDAFWVDVYINPTTPPTRVNQRWQDVGSQGLVWGVKAPALPLASQGVLTLTINDVYYRADLSYFPTSPAVGAPIYTQVDAINQQTTYGAVLEKHEMVGGVYNNITNTLSILSLNNKILPPNEPVSGSDEGLPAR